MKVARLEASKIFEANDEKKRPAKVGEWSGDDLIVRTYPLSDIVNRIVEIGYNVKPSKPAAKQLVKILGELVKKDRRFTMSVIDILNDDTIKDSEIADMIDSNVDEFIDAHKKELAQFAANQR